MAAAPILRRAHCSFFVLALCGNALAVACGFPDVSFEKQGDARAAEAEATGGGGLGDAGTEPATGSTLSDAAMTDNMIPNPLIADGSGGGGADVSVAASGGEGSPSGGGGNGGGGGPHDGGDMGGKGNKGGKGSQGGD